MNLDLNNNSDLLTAITNLENDINEEIVLTQSITNTVCYRLMAKLVKSELCSPKQAVALATVYTAHLPILVNGDSDEWIRSMTGSLQGIAVNGGLIEAFNALPILRAINYVVVENRVCTLGKAVLAIIHADLRSTPPTLVGEELIRKRNYGRTDYGAPAQASITALESSHYSTSASILELARNVWINASREQREVLNQEAYVLRGAAALDPTKAYFSEFFFDNRGREYQAAYYGPNGQTSDLSRALMDLHGVSKDYNDNKAYELLDEEIHDMFKGDEKVFDKLSVEALLKPVEFVLEHLEDGKAGQVPKPWNFVKIIQIQHEIMLGNKPYIGVAVGYDAKCSGPQLGAAMVGCEAMLVSCGFTRGKLIDAYVKGVAVCESKGIKGMTRASIKKAFMAVFYGAGWMAMTEESTINAEAYHTLWLSAENNHLANEEGGEKLAKLFYGCIEEAFGSKLRQLRGAIKGAGYDFENEVCKYNKPMTHRMPDGFEVAMKYKVKIDIDGLPLVSSEVVPDVLVEGAGVARSFQKPTFETNEWDLEAYSRKGFVNMIQATDAQIARLIILHANRLGAQHIVSVHDCFRVNIHDTEILKQAIVCAYMELFGTEANEGGQFTNNLDILKQYFEGSYEATKDEYKTVNRSNVQFYNNGFRILRKVKGTMLAELIQDIDNTEYFGK